MAGIDDIDFSSGGFTVRVEGLRKFSRDMNAAGVDAEDIKDVMWTAGNIVARRATWLAPRRTGKLANNMRVGQAKTKATVKVGSAAVPYARFVYFGRYNESKGGLYQTDNPFIYEALSQTRGEVLRTIEDGIEDILVRHDLK
jgi:hypothetical protein